MIQKIVDFLFPPYCVYCGADQSAVLKAQSETKFLEFNLKEPLLYSYLCMSCFLKVKRKKLKCPLCGRQNDNGANCFSCRKKSFVDRLIYYGDKEDPILKRAVHCFKYQGNLKIAPALAQYLIEILSEVLSYQKEYSGVFSFIPLHPKRQSARGFNQAEVLANLIAAYFHLPALNLLERKKFTIPQVLIEDEKYRKENIKNAFSLKINKEEIPHKRIFLVDDICTTSATIQEAAKVLKRAGARQIWAITIAG